LLFFAKISNFVATNYYRLTLLWLVIGNVGAQMKIFDEKSITLNNGKEDLEVLVYLKEVKVKNNNINTKAFCKILGAK
jgi:hypothetical protein